MSAADNTLRDLIKGAYDLLEFGHDPVAGSWQVPPDAESVHMAGSLLKDAIAALDACPAYTESSFTDPVGAPVRVTRQVPDGTRELRFGRSPC